MQQRLMRLLDGRGGSKACTIGMVDNRGAFVVLTDENDGRHMRFSDEADVIAQLEELNDKLMRDYEKLEASLSRQQAETTKAKKRGENNADLVSDLRHQVERKQEHIRAMSRDYDALKKVALELLSTYVTDGSATLARKVLEGRLKQVSKDGS